MMHSNKSCTPYHATSLKESDPEVFAAIQRERERQETCIELIASENAVFPEIMEAQGSVLTNKYAEGYPGNRYYGGCDYVDEVETLAIERACELFGAEHANVQAHSGSQANMAVYMTELRPDDRILGMDLNHGGHLTHGSPVNFSGRIYEAHHYGIDTNTGLIDYGKVRECAQKVKPKMIIAGASSYSRIIDYKAFREIADEVGALLFVDMAHIAGLVAAGVHPSPVPYADYTTTTTHKTLRGPRGGLILTSAAHAKKLNSQIFPGIQGGPFMHTIAAKAVAFKLALSEDFKRYQEQVVRNARKLGEVLIAKNFSIVSGGTDNHLVLVSLLQEEDLSGKKLEKALDKAGITVNKNAVPNDTRSPFVTSGIRLGTPFVTTRGMGENEMEKLAGLIRTVADAPEDMEVIKNVREQVHTLTGEFPLYASL